MVASRETIKKVIENFRQGAEVAKTSSLRHGNTVYVSTDCGRDVLVSADLHGHRRNFERILEIADLDAHPDRHLVMQEVCHGGATYPSGVGCMSHLMLEEVAALQVKYGERFHFLLSNHEMSELTDFPIMKAKRMLNLLFRCGIQEMYGDAADEVRSAAMEFIAASPIAIRLGDSAVVCHSLPASTDEHGFDASVLSRELGDDDMAEGSDLFRWMWGRDYDQANADAFARAINAETFITGHEPCERGYQIPNTRQVIIDCCGQPACYALLPLDAPLASASEMLQYVRYLHNAQPVDASVNTNGHHANAGRTRASNN